MHTYVFAKMGCVRVRSVGAPAPWLGFAFGLLFAALLHAPGVRAKLNGSGAGGRRQGAAADGRHQLTPQIFDNGGTEEAIAGLLSDRLQDIFYDSVDVRDFPLAVATVFFVPQALPDHDCSEMLEVLGNTGAMQSWLAEAIYAADDANYQQVYILTSSAHCSATDAGLLTFAVEAVVLNMMQTKILRSRVVAALQAKYDNADNLIMSTPAAPIVRLPPPASSGDGDGGSERVRRDAQYAWRDARDVDSEHTAGSSASPLALFPANLNRQRKRKQSSVEVVPETVSVISTSIDESATKSAAGSGAPIAGTQEYTAGAGAYLPPNPPDQPKEVSREIGTAASTTVQPAATTTGAELARVSNDGKDSKLTKAKKGKSK